MVGYKALLSHARLLPVFFFFFNTYSGTLNNIYPSRERPLIKEGNLLMLMTIPL